MASFSLKQLLTIGRSLGLRTILLRMLYPLRQRRYERGWHRPPAQPADEPLGDLLSVHQDGQTLDLIAENGTLRLEVLADDLIRFRLRRASQAEFPALFSYALDPSVEWTPVIPEVHDDGEAVALQTRLITCRVSRSPCRLRFQDCEGRIVSDDEAGLGFRGLGAFWTRFLPEGEAVYGLGEKACSLNLRGRAFEMWNRDPQGFSPDDDPLYSSIPFFIALGQGRAYGCFLDNPGRTRFDVGHARSDQLRYEADTGELCGYFFGGPSVEGILRRYTQLTGRMPLPPRWLLGYHQSRWSYFPEKEVREVADQFRQRRIPCDVLHLDIHFMDGYRVFTWHPDRFPDPPGLIGDLSERGFRVVTNMNPGIKAEHGYAVHDDGLARNCFVTLPDGSLCRGPVWPGDCHFPDFTRPDVRAWWGDMHRPLLEAGVAGFWMDMNEPAVFGGGMPGNAIHGCDNQGASHAELHNAYGLQMVRACAEGAGRLCPDERVALITRSGYAGVQRFALVWTGDNCSTWAHLRLGVSMSLNLGLSGVALCGPDVGGFAGDCSGELLVRWTQVGALTPFFRNHSALGTARQEPWAFGEPYESICRRTIELRYELLPYIYTAAWQAADAGLPIMRPLALAFPCDTSCYSLDDEFLVGDALLVAPVLSPGQTSRPVYLPGGTWYDFWTGRCVALGDAARFTAEAPLERIPIFVRGGTILPMGTVMQHTGEWPPKALRLHVYPGDGQSSLYEDDGHSLAYRSGAYRHTSFACRVTGGTLTLERSVRGQFEPGYRQFDITIHGLTAAPRQVRLDGEAVQAAFDARTQTLELATGDWDRLDIALSA